MNTNVAVWQRLHEEGYFDRHPRYAGRLRHGGDDIEWIGRFVALQPHWRVMVIGAGYGRESALIAPHVRRVYAVDVGGVVLNAMRAYLHERRVTNVVPLHAEAWEGELREEIDLVYSLVTFQHLSRDLVRAYVLGLRAWLAPRGQCVVQFLDSPTCSADADPGAVHEPSVRWTPDEIRALIAGAGFTLYALVTEAVGHDDPRPGPHWWHWAHFGPARRGA